MQENWQSFLETQSAHIDNGIVSGFDVASAEDKNDLSENIITDLSQYDVLMISGEDATAFLHGQFSSEISALEEGSLQYSSWCNIKGRVIVTFILYRCAEGYYLLLEREMTDYVIKRLQMFVMRSKVEISNQSNELVRIGIRGKNVQNQLDQYISKNVDDSLLCLSLSDSSARSIILCSLEQAQRLWEILSEQADSMASAYWSQCEMEAGIAWIGKSASEGFLPQSLNMDLIGALSFDKGCYPGQEIIARMHFRGKLKQRMFLVQAIIEEAPTTISKLYIEGIKQHVGMVINTFMQNNGSCLILVVLDLEHVDNTLIHLSSVDGPVLELKSLPYSLNS